MNSIPTTVVGLMTLMITTLVGVIIYLSKLVLNAWKDNRDLQEKRLQDSIDVRDKYVENIQKFSQTTELLYNKLNSDKGK